METLSLFTWALSKRITFSTSVGSLTVQDLFIIDLDEERKRVTLKDVVIELHNKIKEESALSDELSFLNQNVVQSDDLKRFKLAKFIYTHRDAERKAIKDEANRKAEKQRVAAIIAELDSVNEREKLSKMSPKERKAYLASL